MGTHHDLIPGQKYRVRKEFTDYDREVHKVGETWTFVEHNFLPYEDGLTIHIRWDGNPKVYVFRLQWRPEEQDEIISNFTDYVEAC